MCCGWLFRYIVCPRSLPPSLFPPSQLWNSRDLSLVGVLRGHKRGIWSIEFSPVDRVLASASGDNTVRVWSVVDFSCLKTLEGHTSPVLCVRFLRLGTQLVSGSADGLVKLWSVRDSEVRRCDMFVSSPPSKLSHISHRCCLLLLPACCYNCYLC